MELTLQNVSKKYGEKTALDNISLTLSQGIYALLGPNGAGKTTMMNLITGNLKPTSGKLLWDGQETVQMGAVYRSLIGYAPQQQALYDTFSGSRFLSYMAALKGIPKKQMKEEIRRVLDYVNLTEAANESIGAYSGGMKQRILIAQAILGNPKLLILDEPTAGLDPKERVRIREKIKALSGDKVILVSTHVVSDIQSIAKEVLLLKKGRLADRGSVPALCQKYGTVSDLEQVYMELFGEEEHQDETDTI